MELSDCYRANKPDNKKIHHTAVRIDLAAHFAQHHQK